jgi:hypothetical protein
MKTKIQKTLRVAPITYPESRVPAPLSLEEIALFKQLPALTLAQVARVLQKPVKCIYEMSRGRAKRPLPVFKSGRVLCSTYAKIEAWIEEGFTERAA